MSTYAASNDPDPQWVSPWNKYICSRGRSCLRRCSRSTNRIFVLLFLVLFVLWAIIIMLVVSWVHLDSSLSRASELMVWPQRYEPEYLVFAPRIVDKVES